MNKLLAFLLAALCATAALAQPGDWRWQRPPPFRHTFVHRSAFCPPGLMPFRGGCATPREVRFWRHDAWRRAQWARWHRNQWRRATWG